MSSLTEIMNRPHNPSRGVMLMLVGAVAFCAYGGMDMNDRQVWAVVTTSIGTVIVGTHLLQLWRNRLAEKRRVRDAPFALWTSLGEEMQKALDLVNKNRHFEAKNREAALTDALDLLAKKLSTCKVSHPPYVSQLDRWRTALMTFIPLVALKTYEGLVSCRVNSPRFVVWLWGLSALCGKVL